MQNLCFYFVACYNHLQATASSVRGLTSIGFPRWPGARHSCEWTLSVPMGYIVKLWFRVFDCPSNSDRVILKDGSLMYDSPDSAVIGSYCQQEQLTFNYNCKAPSTVYSLSRQMSVILNFESGQHWTNDGVSMYFTAVRRGRK